MEITVNDKVHELKVTVGMVRKLDSIYKIEQNGLTIGMGISMAYTALDQYSVSDLANILKVAIKGNPSEVSIERALDDYAEEHDGLGGLFEGLKDLLSTSSLTKDTIRKFQGNLEVVQEEEKS